MSDDAPVFLMFCTWDGDSWFIAAVHDEISAVRAFKEHCRRWSQDQPPHEEYIFMTKVPRTEEVTEFLRRIDADPFFVHTVDCREQARSFYEEYKDEPNLFRIPPKELTNAP